MGGILVIMLGLFLFIAVVFFTVVILFALAVQGGHELIAHSDTTPRPTL